MAKKNEVIL